MTYTPLDRDCFRRDIESKLPDLAHFIKNNPFFDFETVMRVTRYQRKWLDTSCCMEQVESFAESLKCERGDCKIALCPAGGNASEIYDVFQKRGIELFGYIDSYKSKDSDEYFGHPLYPMNQGTISQFDTVIVCSKPYTDEIYEHLTEYDKQSDCEITAPFVRPVIHTDTCERNIERINHICEHNQNRTVVYCLDRLYMHTLNRIAALRENGSKVVLLTLEEHIHHSLSISHVKDCFDYMCCTQNNGAELLYILSRIHPDIVHLQPVARNAESSVLMHAVCKAPVVSEFYDMLFSMHSYEGLTELSGKRQADIQFFAEQYLANHSNGIVFKSTVEEGRRLLEHYGSDRPAIQFQNYSVLKESRNSPFYDGDRRINVVYSGGIHVQGMLKSQGWSLLRFIGETTEQYIGFDIYNVHDFNDKQYDVFRSEDDQNPLFSYYSAVENSRVIPILSVYDFGWQVMDMSTIKNQSIHYATAMNAKFYDYISAGLPTIISEEFEYMADIVRKYGLGIVIHHSDVRHLSEIIANHDVNALKENVVKFRNQYCMENNINRLITFYRKINEARIKRIKSDKNLHIPYSYKKVSGE